jgi:hypothetical protein
MRYKQHDSAKDIAQANVWARELLGPAPSTYGEPKVSLCANVATVANTPQPPMPCCHSILTDMGTPPRLYCVQCGCFLEVR